MFDQSADETAVVALFTGVRARLEQIFRPVEDVHNDGRLGLNQRMQLRFQQNYNVLQSFDDAPIEPDAQLWEIKQLTD